MYRVIAARWRMQVPASSCLYGTMISQQGFSSVATTRQRVVVLGTGWAGFRLAKDLDRKQYEVHVVSPRNHMLFTPLLTSAAVGTLETRSVCESIHTIPKETSFHLGKCSAVDPVKKEIQVKVTEDLPESLFRHESTFKLSYDHLIVAVGAQANTFNIKGVTAENVYFLKEAPHASAIRKRIMDCFEAALNPTLTEAEKRDVLRFTIVGGGPTGVEFGGELSDFLREDLYRIYPELKPYVSVSLLEGQHLLNGFDQSLRDWVMSRFSSLDIEVKLGAVVDKVEDGCITLKTGEVVRSGMIVWSTGVAPNKFIREALTDDIYAKNQQGKLQTDAYCRVLTADNSSTHPGLYALGDCAVVGELRLPPTAQVANKQAIYLCNVLNKGGHTGGTQAFQYKHFGSLAYVGRYAAITDVSASDVVPNKYSLRGFISLILWRSTYFTNLGSWRSRFQVPFDWCKSFFLGRDLTRL